MLELFIFVENSITKRERNVAMPHSPIIWQQAIWQWEGQIWRLCRSKLSYSYRVVKCRNMLQQHDASVFWHLAKIIKWGVTKLAFLSTRQLSGLTGVTEIRPSPRVGFQVTEISGEKKSGVDLRVNRLILEWLHLKVHFTNTTVRIFHSDLPMQRSPQRIRGGWHVRDRYFRQMSRIPTCRDECYFNIDDAKR